MFESLSAITGDLLRLKDYARELAGVPWKVEKWPSWAKERALLLSLLQLLLFQK